MNDKIARPYWHVDAKWLVGILFLLSLSATLLVFFLTKVTERENAVQLSSLALATVFSREEGLDGTASLTELKEKVANEPGDVIRPIPEIPVLTITRQDLETLTPREIRLKIFRQLVEPLYDEGLKGAAKRFTSDPAAEQKLVKDASLLSLMTRSTHDRLTNLCWILTLVSLVLLAGLIYFSFGWGRLGNPGLILALVSWPGAIAGLLFRYPPSDGDGGPLKYIPPAVGSELGNHLLLSYGLAFLLSFVLLLTALIGSIISRRRHRST